MSLFDNQITKSPTAETFGASKPAATPIETPKAKPVI